MSARAGWTLVDGLGARVLVRRTSGLIDGIQFTWRNHTVRCEADDPAANPVQAGSPRFGVWRLVEGPAIAPWIPGSEAPDVETLRQWIIARLEAKHGNQYAATPDAPVAPQPFGEPDRLVPDSAPVTIRSLCFRLTPRATLPNPDDAARRLTSMAERLTRFAGAPVTWGIGTDSAVTLSAAPARDTLSETALQAFLEEFEAEAFEFGFPRVEGRRQGLGKL